MSRCSTGRAELSRGEEAGGLRKPRFISHRGDALFFCGSLRRRVSCMRLLSLDLLAENRAQPCSPHAAKKTQSDQPHNTRGGMPRRGSAHQLSRR